MVKETGAIPVQGRDSSVEFYESRFTGRGSPADYFSFTSGGSPADYP